MRLFSKKGFIKDKATIEAEQKIYDILSELIKSYKKRKIPLLEVRAVIQCLMGSTNEGIMIFLKVKNEGNKSK